MKTPIALLIFVLIIGLWGGTAYLGTERTDVKPPLVISWKIASQTPIIFGIIPYGTDQSLAQEFTGLSAYLRRHLGRDVKLLVAPSYQGLARMLASGTVEIARFSAVSFELFNAENQWEVLCRPVISGKVFSRGVLLASVRSGIQKLEDWRGKHFAFVDPYSGTGCIKAKKFFQSRGIDPLGFFGKISYSGNHNASLNGLRSGLYDGIAVYENILGAAPLASGSAEAGREWRMLGATEWILNDPIVVRKEMPAELKTSLKDLFVHMKERDLGDNVAAELKRLRNVDGFLAEEEIQRMSLPKE